MPVCAETHVQQSRISKFSGGGPRPPFSRGGEGGEEREGEGKGRREGKDREGTGRDRGWKEGRNGGGEGREWRGGAFDMGSPPRDKLWIRP